MEDTAFLGPFSRLPQYQPQRLLEERPVGPYPTTVQLGTFCCFDFDVRPQRTCLLTTRHSSQTQGKKINWDEVLTKCIFSVSRTLGFGEGNSHIERGVEGECDDGTVTCWIGVQKTSRKILTMAQQGLLARLARQRWPLHHPDRVQPLLASEPLNPTPGRDRIGVYVLDPATRHTIPMLAENFYFVNQEPSRLTSYPLAEWQDLITQLD